MQDYFHQLAEFATSQLQGEEVYTCSFSAEDSDFVRFNGSRVRQAGSTRQCALTLDLIEGRRHCRGELTLACDAELDRARLARMLGNLRERRACLPEDPFLLYATETRSSERTHPDRLPDPDDVLSQIIKAGEGRDLVGIYAAGGMHSGFANSLGQRNWHSSFSYNLDWSFYHSSDKAVKSSYAGFEWRPVAFEEKARQARDQLVVLTKPAHTIAAGRYSVFLAPTALYEIIDLLRWGGFGLRAHKTKTTPLLRMIEDEAQLHPSVHIQENTRDGITPDFEDAGFIRPERVSLIHEGRYRDCLVSPRSAVEYGMRTNGATAAESPLSLDVSPGDLPHEDVLGELGTGIYVSNLWYLNYSDRSACRTTGMTRFATFWVENGVIQAPLNVMRFDETVYRMLGENLAGLTQEREMILDPRTYGRRSIQSACVPGALIRDLCFTL